VALTQRSFARESVELALAGDWTTSKSEKVSEMSVLNLSNADEVVSDSADGNGLMGRRRLQQKMFTCSKLKLVDMYVMNF
jgi:hypothetical protein